MSEELKNLREIIVDFKEGTVGGNRREVETIQKTLNVVLHEIDRQLLAGATPEGQRLMELAQWGARDRHNGALMGHRKNDGHVDDGTLRMGYPECPHPDCALVRLPAPPAPAPTRAGDK